MKQQALGLIETHGLVAAIEAADAALKAASVELVSYEKVTGGLTMIAVTGEVAAVQSAIAVGSAAAARVGQVVSQHVIPRPLADLEILISSKNSKPQYPDPDGGNPAGGGSPAGDESTANSDAPADCPNSAEDDNPVQASAKITTGQAKRPAAPLEALSVIELRKLARSTDGIAIKGRQIAKANKEQLISEILKARKSKSQQL